MRAVIERGVVGDLRAPDLMRLGVAPLGTAGNDVDRAAAAVAEAIRARHFDAPRHRARMAVAGPRPYVGGEGTRPHAAREEGRA